MSEIKDRLFLPLNSNAFNWYKMGKKWEVRKVKGQYNLKNIRSNRIVELRRGYNTKDRLWGIINEVKIFNNSSQLLSEIDFLEIFPEAKDSNEANNLFNDFVNVDEHIIAFKITLNEDYGKGS